MSVESDEKVVGHNADYVANIQRELEEFQWIRPNKKSNNHFDRKVNG
jgi:hypothetical protein